MKNLQYLYHQKQDLFIGKIPKNVEKNTKQNVSINN